MQRTHFKQRFPIEATLRHRMYAYEPHAYEQAVQGKQAVRTREIQRTIDRLVAQMPLYTLQSGTVLYRVETNKRVNDNPKFYSYLRTQDPYEKRETMWLSRCKEGCWQDTVQTTRPLRLLRMPYGSITYDDLTSQDYELSRLLQELVEIVYKGDDVYIYCAKRGVRQLLEYEESACAYQTDKTLTPDWYGAYLICAIGLDGWIRVVDQDDVNQADEVVICNPSENVRVVVTYDYDAENGQLIPRTT